MSMKDRVSFKNHVEYFRRFVGVGDDYYLKKFKQFDRGDSVAGWNWAALIFGPLWLLYRKMYSFYLLYLIFLFIPYTTFPLFFLMPIFGNFIYYSHVKRSLASDGVFNTRRWGTSSISVLFGGVFLFFILIVRNRL